MDYLKHILRDEGLTLGDSQTFVDIYELLSNQRDIQKIGKKILGTLNLTGTVSLIRFYDNRFYSVDSIGKDEIVQKSLEDKSILKEIRSSKRMYKAQKGTASPYFMALPILSKNNEFLGALCIHEHQKITCWKEIVILLNLMSFVFKYYNMIEFNKKFTIKDSVTPLYNFKHFQHQLDLEINKATRYHMPLSLVLIDIENFKLINEKFGVDCGDEILNQVSKWIEATCRNVDFPARLEADTFAILLSNTPLEGAKVFLNRLLIKINNNQVFVTDSSNNQKFFKIHVKSSAVGFENHYSRKEFLEFAQEELSKSNPHE